MNDYVQISLLMHLLNPFGTEFDQNTETYSSVDPLHCQPS